ncbi:nucleotide-diphospho-sugar transferase [Jimgerdemannia flammicorona]|uniref:Nucleotide-diphospho-sugar transferase n=1 Tax=Jimgerdemannia flammicorona TaxID=994334 RepID=A0A433QRJ4_9FUNG|nr:nucleotide-diphospho-sugar transferase [Jimgerdemannia flammicorona]
MRETLYGTTTQRRIIVQRGIGSPFRYYNPPDPSTLDNPLPLPPHFFIYFYFSPSKKRWGDAPVHSIAAAIFLDPSEIHFFNDIGYRHNPFMHCPQERELQLKCHCNADNNFDWSLFSCTARYFSILRHKELLD